MYVYMYAHPNTICIFGTCGDQKRVLDLPELKFQMLVGRYVGIGNWTHVITSLLTLWDISLASAVLLLFSVPRMDS